MKKSFSIFCKKNMQSVKPFDFFVSNLCLPLITQMKDFEKDILSSRDDLKKMPFATPEGYFENFSVNLHPEGKTAGRDIVEISVFRRISPYLAMAAMFAIIAAAGAVLMKTVLNQEDLQEYGSLAYTDLIPVTDPDTIYYSYNYDYDAISEEDVIEYLIYDGTSIETLNNE